MANLPQVKSCGVILTKTVGHNKQILLMKHRGRIDFSKGHIEAGETDVVCALRELFEETGIKETEITLDTTNPIVDEYVTKYRRKPYNGGEVRKTVVLFIGTAKDEHCTASHLSEHSGFCWFDMDAVKTLLQNTTTWQMDPDFELLRQTKSIHPILSQLLERIK
eukprot:TRINITY_DN2319_c0_g1_i1.p1 TRINITY_DN2319_c0_g1~~TRINITY_DN2319_c0_g1_i1.p1  ORF type:complete len:164 (-),score=37.95 TRINITY_DN2319_c0_g1_i1:23-514(-)